MEVFLTVLLRLSLFGSLSAVLLLLLQPVLRRLAGWTAVYYLWIVVLLRLCIPAGITVPLPSRNGTVHSMDADKTAAGNDGKSGPGMQKEDSSAVRGISVKKKSANADKTYMNDPSKEEEVSEEAVKTTVFSSLLLKGNRFRLPDILQFGQIPWLVVWGAGTIAYLGWHVWVFLHFSRRVRRSLTEAPQRALLVLRGLEPAGRTGLRESDIVHTPLLLGMLHPVIVLPAGMGEESAEMLKDIMAHELVHAKRRDLVYKWFVLAVTSLHWFNPLMFLVRRETGRCCELSCDEAVIRGMNSHARRHYGETLLAAAGAPSTGTGTYTAFLCEEKVRLKERLVCIGTYRKKGICAALLSIFPVLAVAGCAMISGTGGNFKDAVFIESPDGTDMDAENGNGSDNDAETEENPEQKEAGAETAAEDYLAVLTGAKQFLYYEQGKDTAQSVSTADIPALFSPQSSYAEINEFAVVDLDGSGEPEVILHITDVAGDMGGFLILKRQNGEVHGYFAHYKAVSSLKTDGTFLYMSLARPDSGIGTIQFHETGYTVVPLACSKTEEDNHTTVYMEGQKEVSEEEYLAAKEQHDKKTNAVWYWFARENIQDVFTQDGGDKWKLPADAADSAGNLQSGTEDTGTAIGSADGQRELIYKKDGMQYELVKDLVTGGYDWANVLSVGNQVKDSHGHKRTDYNSQEHRFERVGGHAKESYTVRRFDNLLYSAGEYLIFEYDGTIHVSRHTDLYHPVLSYEHDGTYGIITKVPMGYMIADDRSYEIRFYDEQFRQIKVLTGLRAGESGNYYEDGRMAVRNMQTGLKGFMDQKGELVIPCSYAETSDFSNGYASVLTDAQVVPYTEDAGTVQLFYGKGGQWGIIDREGRFVLEPSAEYANESPYDTDTAYSGGIRRFGPVREDGTVDFIASDQEERVLKTIRL